MRYAWAVAAISVLAAGCGTDAERSTIAAQRARWEAVGIDSYEFSLTWSSPNAPAGGYRITVIDGQARRIVRTDGVEVDPAHMAGERPITIDEAFNTLEDNVSADAFSATYDPASGHPVAVHVDESTNAADDEFDMWITELTLDPEVPAATTDPVELRQVQLGAALESGVVVRYEFRVHCGARILGRFNGRWWRAIEAANITAAAWYPPGWEPAGNHGDVLDVELRYDESSEMIVATYGDASVTYEPGPSLADWELCA